MRSCFHFKRLLLFLFNWKRLAISWGGGFCTVRKYWGRNGYHTVVLTNPWFLYQSNCLLNSYSSQFCLAHLSALCHWPYFPSFSYHLRFILNSLHHRRLVSFVAPSFHYLSRKYFKLTFLINQSEVDLSAPHRSFLSIFRSLCHFFLSWFVFSL